MASALGLLEVKGLSRHFGGIRAMDNMELRVEQGEIVGIIGPNGAGKSTFFSVVSGHQKATAGRVVFGGIDVTSWRPHRIARRGLIRGFQANVLFREHTVLWNVLVGCQIPVGFTLLGTLFNVTSTLAKQKQALEQAYEILDFVKMAEFSEQRASVLSYGHQRILSLAISLAARPRLLLLDEPTTGMDADQLETMLNLITKVRDSGVTILLVEHNMRAIFKLCDRIAVMRAGTKLADGTPAEIKSNQEVIGAYLGGGAVDA